MTIEGGTLMEIEGGITSVKYTDLDAPNLSVTLKGENTPRDL